MRLKHTYKIRHTRFMAMLLLLLLFTAMRVGAIGTSFVNFDKKTQNLCVRSITQSEDGLMWFAAESGMYSFDGSWGQVPLIH